MAEQDTYEDEESRYNEDGDHFDAHEHLASILGEEVEELGTSLLLSDFASQDQFSRDKIKSSVPEKLDKITLDLNEIVSRGDCEHLSFKYLFKRVCKPHFTRKTTDWAYNNFRFRGVPTSICNMDVNLRRVLDLSSLGYIHAREDQKNWFMPNECALDPLIHRFYKDCPASGNIYTFILNKLVKAGILREYGDECVRSFLITTSKISSWKFAPVEHKKDPFKVRDHLHTFYSTMIGGRWQMLTKSDVPFLFINRLDVGNYVFRRGYRGSLRVTSVESAYEVDDDDLGVANMLPWYRYMLTMPPMGIYWVCVPHYHDRIWFADLGTAPFPTTTSGPERLICGGLACSPICRQILSQTGKASKLRKLDPNVLSHIMSYLIVILPEFTFPEKASWLPFKI